MEHFTISQMQELQKQMHEKHKAVWGGCWMKGLPGVRNGIRGRSVNPRGCFKRSCLKGKASGT